MSSRFITLYGMSPEEEGAYIAAMNKRAEEIVTIGGIWQYQNPTRIIDVEPLCVSYSWGTTRVVCVRAVKGKPFTEKLPETKRRFATDTRCVWPEDLFQNETARAATRAESTTSL